ALGLDEEERSARQETPMSETESAQARAKVSGLRQRMVQVREKIVAVPMVEPAAVPMESDDIRAKLQTAFKTAEDEEGSFEDEFIQLFDSLRSHRPVNMNDQIRQAKLTDIGSLLRRITTTLSAVERHVAVFSVLPEVKSALQNEKDARIGKAELSGEDRAILDELKQRKRTLRALKFLHRETLAMFNQTAEAMMMSDSIPDNRLSGIRLYVHKIKGLVDKDATIAEPATKLSAEQTRRLFDIVASGYTLDILTGSTPAEAFGHVFEPLRAVVEDLDEPNIIKVVALRRLRLLSNDGASLLQLDVQDHRRPVTRETPAKLLTHNFRWDYENKEWVPIDTLQHNDREYRALAWTVSIRGYLEELFDLSFIQTRMSEVVDIRSTEEQAYWDGFKKFVRTLEMDPRDIPDMAAMAANPMLFFNVRESIAWALQHTDQDGQVVGMLGRAKMSAANDASYRAQYGRYIDAFERLFASRDGLVRKMKDRDSIRRRDGVIVEGKIVATPGQSMPGEDGDGLDRYVIQTPEGQRVTVRLSDIEEPDRYVIRGSAPLSAEEDVMLALEFMFYKESHWVFGSLDGSDLEKLTKSTHPFRLGLVRDSRLEKIFGLLCATQDFWVKIVERIKGDKPEFQPLRFAYRDLLDRIRTQDGQRVVAREIRAGKGYLNLVFGGISKINIIDGNMHDSATEGQIFEIKGDSATDQGRLPVESSASIPSRVFEAVQSAQVPVIAPIIMKIRFQKIADGQAYELIWRGYMSRADRDDLFRVAQSIPRGLRSAWVGAIKKIYDYSHEAYGKRLTIRVFLGYTLGEKTERDRALLEESGLLRTRYQDSKLALDHPGTLDGEVESLGPAASYEYFEQLIVVADHGDILAHPDPLMRRNQLYRRLGQSFNRNGVLHVAPIPPRSASRSRFWRQNEAKDRSRAPQMTLFPARSELRVRSEVKVALPSAVELPEGTNPIEILFKRNNQPTPNFRAQVEDVMTGVPAPAVAFGMPDDEDEAFTAQTVSYGFIGAWIDRVPTEENRDLWYARLHLVNRVVNPSATAADANVVDAFMQDIPGMVRESLNADQVSPPRHLVQVVKRAEIRKQIANLTLLTGAALRPGDEVTLVVPGAKRSELRAVSKLVQQNIGTFRLPSSISERLHIVGSDETPRGVARALTQVINSADANVEIGVIVDAALSEIFAILPIRSDRHVSPYDSAELQNDLALLLAAMALDKQISDRFVVKLSAVAERLGIDQNVLAAYLEQAVANARKVAQAA
ncbi:MAG: hypothetical protein PHN49_00140, partial [Candidatus Omnitrophica bacterium]|nr:hypothetical protein [Candidatus Omnitrophota bacterium]